jgi:NifU-like protein involved in Fe-S cluster formation
MDSQALIQSYYHNTTSHYEIENPTSSYHMGNHVCGDDITVYIICHNNLITERSFGGNTSMITHAAASFLADMISYHNSCDTILSRSETIFTDQ